ncbi:MAG: PAS domain-containing protein [Pirellulales bacterium]
MAGLPPAPARPRSADLADLNQQVLLRHFRAGVVLIDHEGRILHFFGPTSQYLGHPTGEATLNLWDMTHGLLAARLRPAVRQAVQDKQTVTLERVEVGRDDAASWAKVTILPGVGRPKGDLVAIVFEEALAAQGQPSVVTAETREEASLVEQLEGELKAARAELRGAVAELEAANEELRSANEEALSTNEELQSTNEELETSQEELQSVNEELNTVNSELRDKVEQLGEVNNDLSNLFVSTDIATIFLDRELCIKRFTPQATKLLNLIPADVGRPIGHISQKFAGEGLASEAQDVLASLSAVQKEVQAQDGRWYSMHVLPYRTLDDRIDGVVVTFADVTCSKEAEQEAQAARAYAEHIVETVREPLLVLDAGMRVMSANPAFFRLFGGSPGETEGRSIYDLGGGAWDIPALRELLETIIPQNAVFESFEMDLELPDVGVRSLVVNARRMERRGPHPALILLAIEDTTERVEGERAILRLNHELLIANRELEAFNHSVAHDLRSPLVTLSGLSGMLLRKCEEKIGDEEKQWLEQIRETVTHMHGLIDSLMELSRVAKAEVHREPLDLSALAREIAAALALQEPDRKVEFTIQEGLMANGEPRLLRTVLENLLGNAWKFTGKKEVGRIEFAAVDHDGKPAFFVRDNGAGFNRTQAHRLFGIFERLHSRAEFPGDGCGLAIVSRIIQRHEGRVWAEGEVGQGATFYFQLP